jgi:hypothetical protein
MDRVEKANLDEIVWAKEAAEKVRTEKEKQYLRG